MKWNNRLLSAAISGGNERICYASVDGTDLRIKEPFPFSSKWFSHKFLGPGIRYEIGISIEDGHIGWAYGPFPCGGFPDIEIFSKRLKATLRRNEYVVADNGYRDEKCILPNDESFPNRRFHSVIRARHETANSRLKQFAVLTHTFRHNLKLHAQCFHAVANLTQLCLESQGPLFSVMP